MDGWPAPPSVPDPSRVRGGVVHGSWAIRPRARRDPSTELSPDVGGNVLDRGPRVMGTARRTAPWRCALNPHSPHAPQSGRRRVTTGPAWMITCSGGGAPSAHYRTANGSSGSDTPVSARRTRSGSPCSRAGRRNMPSPRYLIIPGRSRTRRREHLRAGNRVGATESVPARPVTGPQSAGAGPGRCGSRPRAVDNSVAGRPDGRPDGSSGRCRRCVDRPDARRPTPDAPTPGLPGCGLPDRVLPDSTPSPELDARPDSDDPAERRSGRAAATGLRRTGYVRGGGVRVRRW
ncbi:hypothetical protein C8E95_3984 [Pseudonocardia autotrophica]|nr:hypothetical protein C8E95_3984 [Pseudonocardia autotrophica]